MATWCWPKSQQEHTEQPVEAGLQQKVLCQQRHGQQWFLHLCSLEVLGILLQMFRIQRQNRAKQAFLITIFYKTKQKQLGGFSIHICKWRLNCWIGASKPAWYSHALCNLESVQDSITVRDSSTYDSWWWALCEPLTQAEGRPCPFPAELHSPAAAKTLSACRELSFTDACEFSIASILRNWLYPVWRKQSKKHARRSAQGHIANLLESLKWRRDRAAGSFSFD